jgi:thiol-disulfide isomerase/thioredoxin
MRTALIVALSVAVFPGVTGARLHRQAAGQTAGAPLPGAAPDLKTPTTCLASFNDLVTKRQQQLRAGPPSPALVHQFSRDRQALLEACTAHFDGQTVAPGELASLAELNLQAGLVPAATAAVDRGLALEATLAPAARADLLAEAVNVILRQPKGEARNARLESIVDELDALPQAPFARRFMAHARMNSYYRGDDIDAGLIKHSTWIIDHSSQLTPEERTAQGFYLIDAYVNMAEAWAGEGQTSKALALLREGATKLADLPRTAEMIDPEIARDELVGKPATPIRAPRWLNEPAGTTTVPFAGKVTLVEFTAHWCGPCRESYPGINRLRQRFAGTDFQVVLATRFYGYFGTARNLDAAAELAHDRVYFGEYHLDVPVAVDDLVKISVQDGQVVYTPGPDPNETAYDVTGIPQIQLIGRDGRIRLIMIGYDDANEAKLAGLIQALLDEK